tara:strand:- start:394 stop:609 length:216 start_codon:yes stop_codon:yes gene_type:complete
LRVGLNDGLIYHTQNLGGKIMWNLNIKKGFDKVVEWDRNLAKRFQDKFNLTDYQMLVVSFTKGFIIGAILL